MTSVDTITQWREDWSSASVVNHTNVTDPIRQPGFDVTRHTWSLMNRFRRGQGSWHANLRKWGVAQSPSCDCGQRQTMNHRRRLPWVSGGYWPRRKTPHTASRCMWGLDLTELWSWIWCPRFWPNLYNLPFIWDLLAHSKHRERKCAKIIINNAYFFKLQSAFC